VLGEREDVDRFYVEFGRRLRDARGRARLSQEALGGRVGLNRTSISNVENGRQRLLLHQLPLLAGALAASMNDLLPPAEADADVLAAVPEDARGWVRQILGDQRDGGDRGE
jgi:transcriptional regulator with XRE-family HTH domain